MVGLHVQFHLLGSQMKLVDSHGPLLPLIAILPKPHDSIARALFSSAPSPTPTYRIIKPITKETQTSRTERESAIQREGVLKRDKGRLERALTEAQRVLLDREKEVTKLRTEKHVEVGVVERAGLRDVEAQLERANERVEQLKVRFIS